ncbi:unnamed protein product [Acanthoscelides obtectus]|nr:unnamed protein product [Acanthoscelides obtectus]CAK1620023.1 Microtubule cross-linking factor 1 [Acanthoscelides obtectus]
MQNKQDMVTAMEELRLKLKDGDSQNDDIEIEKNLREFITELYIKREEVRSLEEDNKQLLCNNSELRKQLDESNKTCKEIQMNLDMLKQKSPNVEEELFEKRDTLVKLQMQSKTALLDITTLKEKLEKSEFERNDLSKKLDMLENKFKHSCTYQNEIMKRDSELRRQIEDINEGLIKLKSDQAMVAELAKQPDLAVDAMVRMQQLSRKIEKLAQERDQYQDLYVKINGKLRILEESLSQEVDATDLDSLTTMIFKKWKLSEQHYHTQIEEKNDLLTKLCETIKNEQATNEKLIFENEELKKMYEGLQQEIQEIKKKKEGELNGKTDEKNDEVEFVTVKSETILIDD